MIRLEMKYNLVPWKAIGFIFLMNVLFLHAMENTNLSTIEDTNVNSMKKYPFQPDALHDHIVDMIQCYLDAKDVGNFRICFTKNRISSFQILPILKKMESEINSSFRTDFILQFKVKNLHTISVYDNGMRIEDKWKPRDYWKEFIMVDVHLGVDQTRESGNLFSCLYIQNAHYQFKNTKKPLHCDRPPPTHGSFQLNMTFLVNNLKDDSKIKNKIIFQQKIIDENRINFVIFDLLPSENLFEIQRNELRGAQGKIQWQIETHKNFEDKNFSIFKPYFSTYEKNIIPGQLHENFDRNLIFIKNFNPIELNFEKKFLLQPLNFGSFDLTLSFEIENISAVDGSGNSFKINPKFKSICVANVLEEKGKPVWRFENSIFLFEPMTKIIFDLEKNKIYLLNTEIIESFSGHEFEIEKERYTLNLKTNTKPILELKNFQKPFPKIYFSENRQEHYKTQSMWEKYHLE